ncbi:MAG: hypothetical protein R3330_18775, partial [Saprospiraceae bacterium]|nr:hypothetical protein [Saprospiraceae bacterium]
MQQLPGPIQRLAERLADDLPGRAAQVQMAHAGRARMQFDIRSNVRPAAVLILVYPRGSRWHTVL